MEEAPAEQRHVPVMLHRCLDLLAPALESPSPVVVDATLGMGGHTEAILTRDVACMNRFVAAVDSAAVMVNASTRFTDGGQLGLGAELGISTQKLHARGPMALAELTTTKWIVDGDGQIR